MIRSITIFGFFALSTIMVIVLQPGPRPDYTYEQTEKPLHETTRNDVQVLPEPQVAAVLIAPDETIAKLKAAAEPVRSQSAPVASERSVVRLQAALNASLGKEPIVSDARVESAPKTPVQKTSVIARAAAPMPAAAIAPELRDMSWQTLNALNGIGHVSKAPGQEGSLLNSIVRRSMGHVDGTQVVRPAYVEETTALVAQAPVAVRVSTQGKAALDQDYTVASGDTLALIAIKLYGSALATDRLMRDNPVLRQNPNALRIGQVLKYSMQ